MQRKSYRHLLIVLIVTILALPTYAADEGSLEHFVDEAVEWIVDGIADLFEAIEQVDEPDEPQNEFGPHIDPIG